MTDDEKLLLWKSFYNDAPPYVWQSIETLPQGHHVALWFPKGERGIGGIETATVFIPFDTVSDWDYWTHGGPNSGGDFGMRHDERPTLWMKLENPADET